MEQALELEMPKITTTGSKLLVKKLHPQILSPTLYCGNCPFTQKTSEGLFSEEDKTEGFWTGEYLSKWRALVQNIGNPSNCM